MSEATVKSNSDQKTRQLARRLAQIVDGGDVITLNGQLGAGKTTFVQGFAEGLGIKDTVTSPTFNIVNSYDGNFALNHFDMYRLENQDYDPVLIELIDSDAVSVIEWGQFAPGLIPADHLSINISVEDQVRDLTMVSHGVRSQKLLEEYRNNLNSDE
jgi:tRNA threonylcarbamoyladenosine biosynthesis protein TsaE